MSDDRCSELIKIGQFTSPHGVRGEMRVFPLTDFPERFVGLREVLVGPEGRPWRVRYKGMVKNLVILALDGVTDREQADKFRLQYLQVPRSERHPLPADHFYVVDLIDLDVVDPEGNPLGRLVRVDQNSLGHDLYVIKSATGKEHLVPAVKEFVREISLEHRRIVVKPIPGLFEE